MSFRSLATMTALTCSFAALASAPARAACSPARASSKVASLPPAWRTALDDLVSSTAEPGHPWSCAGGTIELSLDSNGAVLRVARANEPAVERGAATPDDVLPLGQALLATPLPSASSADELLALAPALTPLEVKPAPKPPPPAAPQSAVVPKQARPRPTTGVAPTASSKPARRLLLSAGADARYVGGSDAAWLGPTLSAGLVMGRWLPSISFREQTAVVANGAGLQELSVAVTVQSRFELSPFELRAGLALRGAAVLRDLPRPLGEQSRLEGRIGAVMSFVVPLFRCGNLVLSADGDLVGVSRETAEPATATSDTAPTPFPTFTLGGSIGLEVPL